MAFQTLEQLLTAFPVLGYPHPDGHLILDTDASAHAIGVVLSQVQQGKESPGVLQQSTYQA